MPFDIRNQTLAFLQQVSWEPLTVEPASRPAPVCPHPTQTALTGDLNGSKTLARRTRASDDRSWVSAIAHYPYCA